MKKEMHEKTTSAIKKFCVENEVLCMLCQVKQACYKCATGDLLSIAKKMHSKSQILCFPENAHLE